MILMIEKMQAAMHACQGPDAAGRYHQLVGRFRRLRGSALQRQQADDQLHAVDEPMLELLSQHDLAFGKLILLSQVSRFACQCSVQFSCQNTVWLLILLIVNRSAPKENWKSGFVCLTAHDSPSCLLLA